MSEIILHVRAGVTREDVITSLRSLPQEVTSGSSTDMQDALNECGLLLLSNIRDAFIVKSKGGTDESGERWAPLRPYTIEMRRRRLQKETSSASHPTMRRIHSVIKAGNKSKVSGKISNFDKYAGSVNTDILRDTGALLNSLTSFSDSPYQVFHVDSDSVTIGTTREGASDHHIGVAKRRLPQRRLWPAVNDWPEHWWDDILGEIRDGIVSLTIKLIEEIK